MSQLPAEIFKAYDIRGIVNKSLTADVVRQIGHALGSLAAEQGQKAIAVGRDGRLSGPELAGALMDGICAAGIDAIDVGCVPTPVTYFAAYELGVHSCVSVTGSHNPPDYNGLKMVIGGTTLALDAIQDLKKRIEAGNLKHGQGKRSSADVLGAYVEKIVGDVKLARPMKIVMDCGNGVAGAIAPELFKRLGCDIVPLYCEVDGELPEPSSRTPVRAGQPRRPDHHGQSTERNADAEIGLAFDGDGDRLGVVDRKDGEIILWAGPAADALRAPTCSRAYPGATDHLRRQMLAACSPTWIRDACGVPLMWKTGHSLIKAKMQGNRRTARPAR